MHSPLGHGLDIVIVTFNSPPLPRALWDIANNPSMNLFVLDNGSDVAPDVPPGARLELLGKNVGFGAACNRIIDLGAAPFILFLNPDCVADEETIEALLEQAIQSDSGKGVIVAPRATGHEKQRVLPAGAAPSASSFLAQYLGLSRTFLPRSGFNLYDSATPRAPVDVAWVGGGCLLITRNLFIGLKGFLPEYFLYGEDVDLCLRAQDQGARVLLAGQLEVEHLIGTGSTAGTHLRMAWLRNLRTLVLKRDGYLAKLRFDASLVFGALIVTLLRPLGIRPTLGRPGLSLLFKTVLFPESRGKIPSGADSQLNR